MYITQLIAYTLVNFVPELRTHLIPVSATYADSYSGPFLSVRFIYSTTRAHERYNKAKAISVNHSYFMSHQEYQMTAFLILCTFSMTSTGGT